MVEAKIARYGNSLTLRLPAAMARDLDLHEGDRVLLRRVEQGLVLELPTDRRLSARLRTVRRRETELRALRPVGAEIVE